MALLWLTALKDNHAGHLVNSGHVRYVIALNAVGQSLQGQKVCKLFHRTFGAYRLPFFLCAVFFKSVVGVGVSKVKKLLSHPLFW